MIYYLTAGVLILHAYFWGIGLALLTLPPHWRRYWWAFAPCYGYALQSAVVWFGAHTSLPGTDSYARWSELLPLALSVVAVVCRWRPAWRGARSAVLFAGVLLLPAWLWLSPLAAASRTLTSSSLGSCDHADYAAGARVFQEFSRQDRTGLLGQTEVTAVGTSQTFFDFWLRLNHFTPSALVAHNCSITGLKPHEIISLTGVVLALLNLPPLLLLARIALGLRGPPAALLALLYALTPVNSFAIHHGFLGQLYAAQGIMILTLAAFGATGSVRLGLSPWRFGPLCLAAIWLLAGSYNFILLVALAPGAAWLMAEAWRRRDLRTPAKTVGMWLIALALCVVIFLGRFDGLMERMALFRKSNFGWAVPLLTPEAWLGLARDIRLNPWPAYPRILLVAVVSLLWLAGVLVLWRKRRLKHALAALALVGPAAIGWGILALESRTRANASYDAFKIISVFLPGMLVGLCAWVACVQRGRRRWQVDATLALVALLAANFWVSREFQQQMRTPWLQVGEPLLQLAALEKDPGIPSVNLLLEKTWDRLWANALLLKKPQYFSQSTYEGRRPTELKGAWSLTDLPPGMAIAEGPYVRKLNAQYLLSQDNAPGRIDVEYGDGWYSWEKEGTRRWRWSSGEGVLRLRNPAASALAARVRMKLSANRPRRLFLTVNGLLHSTVPVDRGHIFVDFGAIELSPGTNVLALWSQEPPVVPGGNDKRKLSFALHELAISEAQAPSPAPANAADARLPVISATTGARMGFDYRDGWYGLEKSGAFQWRWSSGEADVLLINPLPMPVTVKLSAGVSGATVPRTLQLTVNNHALAPRPLETVRQTVFFGTVTLQPGPNRLLFKSPEDPVIPGGGDKRSLSFALYHILLREPVTVGDQADVASAPPPANGGSAPAPIVFPPVEGFAFGRGWYKPEKSPTEHWRWSSGESTILLNNPTSAATLIRLKLRFGSIVQRQLQVLRDGKIAKARLINQGHNLLDFGEYQLPPGDTVLTLFSPEPPIVPGGADKRELSFALFEVVIER